MLRFSEQLILLALDDDTGLFYPIPEHVFDLSIAASMIFELSFKDLIDDDWKEIKTINKDKYEDRLLDESLNILAFLGKNIELGKAVAAISVKGKEFKSYILSDLLKRQILISPNKRKITDSNGIQYYKSDIKSIVDLKREIRDTVLSESIPSPEILAVISLIEACRLTKYIFTSEELTNNIKRIEFLSNLEFLGREIIRIIAEFDDKAWFEKCKNNLIKKHENKKDFAGGADSIISSASYVFDSVGLNNSRKLINKINKYNGYECTGCSWPNPESKRSLFEFCESGAKNISSEATNKIIDKDFFDFWELSDLDLLSDYWIEKRGRLTLPMYLKENSNKYEPISYQKAFKIIAEELKKLKSPDEAIFYTSGRASNEAAFLFQLFARIFGTNNLPGSANLCHEPSGKALSQTLGFGKGSVSLSDFEKADAIFIFGHNPGSNHPRMLKFLQKAVENGCKIVSINPMMEPSLVGFANPQEMKSYFGKTTHLTSLYVQPIINGDLAFIKGMIKYIFEIDAKEKVIDYDFINSYTTGFQELKSHLDDISWDTIVNHSGVNKDQIVQAAEIYCRSNATIISWCLGITQHKNSLATIREIVNLLLLKGNIGKPGAGIFPVRGHSNVQGHRTVGIGENMPKLFMDNMSNTFGINPPKEKGYDAVSSIKAMYERKAKVFISLGGNLLSAAPDYEYTKKAMSKCDLTVMISTKFNRNHIITGKKAIILPCLIRSEIDIQSGKEQNVSIENALGEVSFSKGIIKPIDSALLSETKIIAGIAKSTLGESCSVNWEALSSDYRTIREYFPQIIPDYKGFNEAKLKNKSYELFNPLKKRIFKTDSKKAKITLNEISNIIPEKNEFLMMTIRSHDQFNTTIFGLNDRYRGIKSERKVVFMNEKDMESLRIDAEQLVSIISNYNGVERRTNGYYAIPYAIKQGCVAAYFPEINNIIPIDNISDDCTTPAYKSVLVSIKSMS